MCVCIMTEGFRFSFLLVVFDILFLFFSPFLFAACFQLTNSFRISSNCLNWLWVRVFLCLCYILEVWLLHAILYWLIDAYSVAIVGSSNNLKVYHNYLASSYHMGIISGFMLISSYLESVASTGRTVRAALSYLNFLQNRFYFSNSWNNLIACFWIQMQQGKLYFPIIAGPKYFFIQLFNYEHHI